MSHTFKLFILSALTLLILAVSYYIQNTQVRPYVQQIHIIRENEQAFGSAVVIQKEYLLSVAHVFRNTNINSTSKIIIVKNKKQILAKIVKIDYKRDLVLLKADVDCPCASLATSPPLLDENVAVVGYPYPTEIRIQIQSTGTYQGVVNYYNEGNLNDQRGNLGVISAQAAPGSSGGGAFCTENFQRKLFGIVHAVHYAGTSGPPMTTTFVIPAETIKEFLGEAFPSPEEPPIFLVAP